MGALIAKAANSAAVNFNCMLSDDPDQSKY